MTKYHNPSKPGKLFESKKEALATTAIEKPEKDK